MKTETAGNLKAVAAWWVGKTAKCLQCGFAGKLEAGDPVTAIAEKRPEGTREVMLPCPTAGCFGTAKYSEKLPGLKADSRNV